MNQPLPSLAEALARVASTRDGLNTFEAARRLEDQRKRPRRQSANTGAWRLLLNQFRGPLVVLLLAAMALSFALGDHTDALIVLAVVLMSTLLGFWQEYHAANAVAALLARVQCLATVLRDGKPTEFPVSEVVRGDVVLLDAGDTIPGDGVLIESKDLFVDESALTGESHPAEKLAGTETTGSGSVFEGTHVVSGTARMLVLHTGADTKYGGIAERLRLRQPETDFERGLRRFGEMLIRVTLLLVIGLFAINVFFHRPVLPSFMFALALAVGMAPEMLPAIVSITLARGAQGMARNHVIVRKLASIENFGGMDVLCADKTGTLTEGKMRLHGALDAQGKASDEVLLHAALNARFESGFTNPIDTALRAENPPGLEGWVKLDEVPYDFIRKRLSVVVGRKDGDERHLMITKGAFESVLAACGDVAMPEGNKPASAMAARLRQEFQSHGEKGLRVLAVAVRDVTGDPMITKEDETDMTFIGFLLFEDPPKAGATAAIGELHRLGVGFKVITGDNRVIARRLGQHMGMEHPRVLTGGEMSGMREPALSHLAKEVDVFAEIEPNQKERIITALRQAGHVVGYLGDGINDAPALHAADVGISVDGAVDVAREAADIVLLRPDLDVLAKGVMLGRATFANTLKYVFITTSANFGNMLSMAGASLFLPFLPLLPKQVLLNNFLSDIPALTISADAVDPEQLESACRWDQALIRRFMILFGLVSTVFDFLTFGVLLFWLRAGEQAFQTCWFVESLMTELFIVMVIRTRRPFLKSKPSRVLWLSTMVVAAMAVALPYTPLAKTFGLIPLPATWMALLLLIVACYLLASEMLKASLFRRLRKA